MACGLLINFMTTIKKIILIILILAIIGGLAFLFIKFTTPAPQTGSAPSENFLANFLPFGKNKNATPVTTPPADVSGFIPEETTQETPNTDKLKKVSNLQVAGFGVFQQERFKDVPVVIPEAIIPPPDLPLLNGEEKSNTNTTHLNLPEGKTLQENNSLVASVNKSGIKFNKIWLIVIGLGIIAGFLLGKKFIKG